MQIGIRGRDGGTEWFGCPRGGGTLYIAGFSGSIICPNATEFCGVLGFRFSVSLKDSPKYHSTKKERKKERKKEKNHTIRNQ